MLDLAIVGSGPAGLAAAIRARQRGLSVRVLSKVRSARTRLGESLSPAAAPVLQTLGCWEGFLADGHLSCPSNSWCWGSKRLEFRSFIMDPRGSAWHVDRPRFEQRLRARALELGAELIELRKTPGIEPHTAGWRVRTERGASAVAVETRFLLDASGRGASIARALGAGRTVEDRQVAVVGHLRPLAAPLRDRSSLVEAMPDGWCYSTRLPDGDLAALIFTTRERGIELAASMGRFMDLLGESLHTSARIRGYRPVSPPRVLAAGGEHLTPVAGEGWRAAGDAALTYDPIASHGLTFALASGRDAADSIADALAGNAAEACAHYALTLERARHGYAAARRRIYAAEGRWADRPYWRSRI